MASNIILGLALAALLPWTGMNPKPDGLDEKNEARFFELIRVLGIELSLGEVTVVDPKGKSRTWEKGDQVIEENAVLEKVTSSLLVFTRNVEGPNGGAGESLVVVRFDSSGRTRVREYSSRSDSPLPMAPPHDSYR